jgi:hypothetical protein
VKKPQNKTPKAIEPKTSGVPSPPPELVRPRNGTRAGNALGVDKFSGPDGGGKSRKHFTPLVDGPVGTR